VKKTSGYSLAALSALIATGCVVAPTDRALTPEPPVDASPPEQETYAAVYDPAGIEALIRQVPEYPEWEYVYAHIQAINSQAELGPGVPVDATLSPTVDPEMARVTLDAYSKAMGIWSFFGVEEVPAVWTLMSELDYDWWRARVVEVEGEQGDLAVWDAETSTMGHCSLSSQSFCGYGNPNAETGITAQYNVIGSDYRGVPNADTVAHEGVHFYQDVYSQDYYSFMPCWFVEGQANLLGKVISGSVELGAEPYGSSDLSRTGRELPGDESWSVEQWEELLDGYTYDQEEMQHCTEESWNYILGAVLFEYLYGHYSMWDIHLLTVAAAESKDWELALQDTLGLSVGELHRDLATHLYGLFQEYQAEN